MNVAELQHRGRKLDMGGRKLYISIEIVHMASILPLHFFWGKAQIQN